MKKLILFLSLGLIILSFSVLHAQNIDYLGKAKEFLAQGDCERARYAYEDYKKTHPSGDADVERGIAECVKTPQPSTVSKQDLTFTVTNELSFRMIYVKGGTFQMGSNNGADDEKPVHSVTLSDFYMGEFEVTQALWQEVMGTTVFQQRDKVDPSWPISGVGSDYPMYYICYREAKEFCGRLNLCLRDQLPAGYSFALPTEAEWEYAARGGSKSNTYTYSGSNYLSDVGWYYDNSNKSTHPVGLKKANELGLYDMSGNVWEWCADWYGTYSSSSQTNPKGPGSGSVHVVRGSGWNRHDSVACRAANSSSDRFNVLGFRLALVHR